jgi:hypothetical protein
MTCHIPMSCELVWSWVTQASNEDMNDAHVSFFVHVRSLKRFVLVNASQRRSVERLKKRSAGQVPRGKAVQAA